MFHILAACAPSTDAPRLHLPVQVDPAVPESFVTDLGYRVDVEAIELALEDVRFTAKPTATLAKRWLRGGGLVQSAWAHPGHTESGAVQGEMLGQFVARWPHTDPTLGTATVLPGAYGGMDFRFGHLDTGPAWVLRGTAHHDDASAQFVVEVEVPDGRDLVGAIFDVELEADDQGVLTFDFDPTYLLDGVDLFALEEGEDGLRWIKPSDAPEYHLVRRRILEHDPYVVVHHAR